jgi:hypothetical protein
MLVSLFQRFRKLDPGLLIALLLATLSAWPLLTRASLPAFTDAEQHAFRTYEIMAAWQAGAPYLRWAPDLFYGYGYPVFHYYAPLSYYLGAAYGLACCGLTVGAVAGVKFVLVLSAYLGAVGMYLFVRDRWGGAAGVVSAAAFAFAPYIVYIDPHGRGDAPETLALALAPLMLWAFARLRRTASPGDAVVAAVILAALILSHNLMALIFFGLLLAWLAWDLFFGQMFFQAWVQDENKFSTASARWKVMGMLVLAAALGLLLSAFMWLPAVLERDAVQFRNVAGGTFFDFRRHFIGLRELFAPALLFDLGATEMRFNHNLGLAQWILGGLGLLTVFITRARRLSALFFALCAIIFVYFMLPASQHVWEAIPPMAYLQFPTRLLGPAAVALAVLAGAAVSWVEAVNWRWRHSRLAFAAGAVALCIGSVTPLMYPAPWPDYGNADARRLLATELDGRGIGTTSANDFLPVQVVSVPGPQSSVIDSYLAGQSDKVNRATLPEGATVRAIQLGPEMSRFHVAGDADFVFRLFTFYFPGWSAYVDGAKVDITPSAPEGWLTFWVPAGEHDVTVRLENTPPRWAGWIISGLALTALTGLTIWRVRLPVTRPPVDALSRNATFVFAMVIGLWMLVRWADDRAGWFRVQSTGNNVLVAEHQNFAALENNVALLAFDLPQISARPGAKVPVTLYWKAQTPVTVNLRVFIHFIGPDGQLWGQSDKWNPADFPTTRFPLDRYVRDEHQAGLRPDAPPGTYTVVAGLWDGGTGARMRVLDAAGNPTEVEGVVLTTSFEVK